MASITIPSVIAAGAQMRLIRGDSMLEFMDGSAVGVQSTKALWVMSFPLRPTKTATARDWLSFLAQASKAGNTFTITPPGYVKKFAYGGSQIQVQGGSQTGLTLLCDGPSSLQPVLVAGEYFEVNGELKIATADATAEVSGDVTFNFEPALRSAPADNANVEVNAPTAIMRLVSQEAAWAISLGDFYEMTIDAIEHFGP